MQRPTQNQEPSTAAQRPQLVTRTLNSNCCEAANSNLTNTMKTKIPHLILAGLLGTSITSQGATVLYQSDFTGADLNSAGLYTQGFNGYWTLDTANDWADGVQTGSNARAGLYSNNSWTVDGTGYKGFQLDVTWRNSAAMARYSFGLVDEDWTTSPNTDWLNQSPAGAYGIGFHTAGEAGADGLSSNNDAGTLTTLSTAQGDETTGGALQTMSITVTDTTWSYSLNGAAATTGTHTFDTSRNYRFAAWSQRAERSSITNITITAIPEPSSTALLGLGGLALALRRRRS